MDSGLTVVKIDEIEDTFLDDDEDLTEVNEKLYSLYCYPETEPTSVRFKGKSKNFVKSVDALKVIFKKGVVKTIDVTTCKILDSRKAPHSLEFDIETEYDNEKGMAVLKVYGPTPKKGATVMVSKSKDHEVKFVERLAMNVIKQMLDRYVETDCWKKIFEKVMCRICKKPFCNEKNLTTHMEKYHDSSMAIKCNSCSFSSNSKRELETHIKDVHEKNEEKEAEYRCDTCNVVVESEEWLKGHNDEKHGTIRMEVDGEEGTSITEFACTICSFTGNDKTILNDHVRSTHEENHVKVKEVDQLQMKLVEYEKEIANLNKQVEEKVLECDELKKDIRNAVKENKCNIDNIKKLRSENESIMLKLTELQFYKDKSEAEKKSKESESELRGNIILSNRSIEKQLEDGRNKDVDINNYKALENNEDAMDVEVEVLEERNNTGKEFLKCKFCDFISMNDNYFNEHITKVHGNQIICPYCFHPYKEYVDLRSHIQNTHKEVDNVKSDRKKKQPCRYFRNGEGSCNPKNGHCNYDHNIIPFVERAECLHKQNCQFKPYCIFYHPEGQGNLNVQNVRNDRRLCRFAANGVTCPRKQCSFYHPLERNSQGFQREQQVEPPPLSIQGNMEKERPVRVSVIVMNQKKNKTMLSQTLTSLNLNQ